MAGLLIRPIECSIRLRWPDRPASGRFDSSMLEAILEPGEEADVTSVGDYDFAMPLAFHCGGWADCTVMMEADIETVRS